MSGPIMFRFGDASNIGDRVNSALHALFISGFQEKLLNREIDGYIPMFHGGLDTDVVLSGEIQLPA
ncbi:MAG: hypothetical protein U5N53_00135 [Mycobacterium sp.]|nr:hypothetical protein [Mycobacterium sp.]